MKKTLMLLLTLISVNTYCLTENLTKGDFKLILSSQNMKEEKTEFLDINSASEVEMLSRGIGSSYVEKIIEYRDVTGGFESLDELKRIKGIGDATCTKLKKSFKIESDFEKKVLNINEADEKILKYFGFSKKEIKNIQEYIEKNRKITNNIELKILISKKKYDSLKDLINYN